MKLLTAGLCLIIALVAGCTPIGRRSQEEYVSVPDDLPDRVSRATTGQSAPPIRRSTGVVETQPQPLHEDPPEMLALKACQAREINGLISDLNAAGFTRDKVESAYSYIDASTIAVQVGDAWDNFPLEVQSDAARWILGAWSGHRRLGCGVTDKQFFETLALYFRTPATGFELIGIAGYYYGPGPMSSSPYWHAVYVPIPHGQQRAMVPASDLRGTIRYFNDHRNDPPESPRQSRYRARR